MVLSYHRVLPRDFPELGMVEPGMFVFDDTFRMHLDQLLLYFEPVDLAYWIKCRDEGSVLPKRAVAITFDDGWRDNYQYAFPVLKELGIPATIFVVSALAGSEYSFWPEHLARRLQVAAGNATNRSDWLEKLVRDAGVSFEAPNSESISRVIAVAKRESDASIHGHLDRLDERFGPVSSPSGRDLADWAELKEMGSSGLVAIGSHTRHHVRMREDLTTDQLKEEIIDSCGDIEKHCGEPAELFCFPNGDMTSASIDLVRKTYLGACTTQHGWNAVSDDAHSIRRVPLHQDRSDTKNALLARVIGAL